MSVNKSIIEEGISSRPRKSFLPQNTNLDSVSLHGDSVYSLQKQNDQLRQQNYKTLVDALSINNETLITSQRNEIFKLKMSMEDQTKKIQKLELRNQQLEAIQQSMQKEEERLNQVIATLKVANEQYQKIIDQKDDKMQSISEQLGVFKTQGSHINEQIQEKDKKIAQLQQELITLDASIDERVEQHNKALMEEIDSWKHKFIDLSHEYRFVKEQLAVSQAEMESACKTRDSIISKTNEIRTNGNTRRRTMMVRPTDQE